MGYPDLRSLWNNQVVRQLADDQCERGERIC